MKHTKTLAVAHRFELNQRGVSRKELQIDTVGTDRLGPGHRTCKNSSYVITSCSKTHLYFLLLGLAITFFASAQTLHCTAWLSESAFAAPASAWSTGIFSANHDHINTVSAEEARRMSSMETSVQSIDASSALQMLLLLIAAEGGYGPVLTLVASVLTLQPGFRCT